MNTIDRLSHYLYTFINGNIHVFVNKDSARNTRHSITSVMEKMLYKTPLSKNSLGVVLRGIHITGPFVLLMLLSVCKFKTLCNIILIILFLIPMLFIVLDGCLLTSLEKRIINDDFTVIDPLLEIYGKSKTRINRIKMNYFVCFLYLFIGIIIYTYRFYM